MGHGVGIDVGTTFSAAAVFRDGQVRTVTLGQHADAVPTALFLPTGGDFLVGEAAVRRLTDDPAGGAREFKRRMGDTTPIVVGGAPYSADRLMGVVIGHVLERVAEREGEPPDHVVLTHPANWQEFKIDLLRQAARRVAGTASISLVEEPVAAAIHYARSERIDVGELVGVYDLGGGTFDAAVLERTQHGFRALGEPAGIERLGGMDMDAALLAHVHRSLGDRFETLDRGDRAVRVGLEQLRHECVEAKQVLSVDTSATINVSLPGLHDAVRITRGEFEDLIRPVLRETLDALRAAIESAGTTADHLAGVLLIGGSSRIPLVSEIVSSELGRPVVVDAHPKLSVAMGAAAAAGEQLHPGTVMLPPSAAAARGGPHDEPGDEPAEEVVSVASGSRATVTEYGHGVDRGRLLRAALAVAGVVVVAALAWQALAGGDGGGSSEATDSEPFVEIRQASIENGFYRIDYETSGFTPEFGDDPGQLHIHVFFDTTDPALAGRGGAPESEWTRTQRPSSFVTQFRPADRGAAQQICAVVATGDDRVLDPDSGNCVILPPAPAPSPTVLPPTVTPTTPSPESPSTETTTDTGSPSPPTASPPSELAQ